MRCTITIPLVSNLQYISFYFKRGDTLVNKHKKRLKFVGGTKGRVASKVRDRYQKTFH